MENGQKNKYIRELTVPCYHTDAKCLLKPSAFMDIMQEMAYLAATRLNFGYDTLHAGNTAWVLSRMHFTFGNPPAWRDTVRIETWHKGLEGLMFLRDFRMTDTEGTELLACTSSWLVMDIDTRRLVRSESLLGIVPEDTRCDDDAIAEPAPKIVMPHAAEAEMIAGHTVAYSDVDLNGHTNNVRYIVWAMDCIDYTELTECGVRDVKINFNRETVPGDRVELYSLRSEEDGAARYIIEGKVEGRQVFITEISLGRAAR